MTAPRKKKSSRGVSSPSLEGRPDASRPRGGSLLQLPMVPWDAADKQQTMDVVLSGVPSDRGSMGRAGARDGSAAIRAMSWIGGGYCQGLGIETFAELSAADGGDVTLQPGAELADVLSVVQARVAQVARAGAVSALVGGDGTATLAALRGVRQAKRRPVGLLHVDAFHDLGSGGGASRRIDERSFVRHAVEERLVRPEYVVQVGIRSPAPSGAEQAFALGQGFEVVTMDEVRWDIHSAVSQVRRVVGRGALYVSVDLAALDPSAAPGVSIPAPGGMNAWELQQILRALVGADIVGFDVVGLVPALDVADLGASVAVVALQEMLAVLADTRRSGRPAVSSARAGRAGRRSA